MATVVNGIEHQTNGYGPSGHCAESRVPDVCVIGAGPAGLMLAVILARLGLHPNVVDEREDATSTGRADGLQPKTIETLQMLRLGDELLRKGVRIHDICMWRTSSNGQGIERIGREVHYPKEIVDVLHPYILLVHQGMIEDMLIKDLALSGFQVRRNHRFSTLTEDPTSQNLKVHCATSNGQETTLKASYIVGCDGSRSSVRQCIPGTFAQRSPQESYWGVLDGEIDTDFPDIWSKTVIFSETHGSLLVIPRERNMTRFYIELKPSAAGPRPKDRGQDFVMSQAQLILAPWRVSWRSVEWFGNYQVAQRVAAKFSDPSQRVFIAGDASHAHSPKAAQGLNTSVHDSWNLGWKLNFAARGLARPALLESYETERRKIAQDLIDFDYEHATQIAGGDIKKLAENFRTNTRFIAGVGIEYLEGPLVLDDSDCAVGGGGARPGQNLPPAKASLYINANPVDIQQDIPMLGQFRIYAVVHDVREPAQAAFLDQFSASVRTPGSLLRQLSDATGESYLARPRPQQPVDDYLRPERYTTVSDLFTFCVLTSTPKADFEISGLPEVFAQSPWTVYLDDVPELDSTGKSCTEKWLGTLEPGRPAILVVRPDGYVGALKRFDVGRPDDGMAAAQWLGKYFEGFLQVPA